MRCPRLTPLLALPLALALCGCADVPRPTAASGEIRLIPQPRRLQAFEGAFRLPRQLRVAAASGEDEDVFAAGLLVDDLRAAGAARVEIVRGGSGQIVLTRRDAPAEVGDQGYRIDVDRHGAKVSASSGAGIYYGVQTLRQLIRDGGIPALRIVDWPALRWRGAQDDLSRGPVPTVESLERRIRTLAEYKTNLYMLYMEDNFAYPDHPLFPPREGSLTPAQVRGLVAFARQHHVELVPEQQSFGHLHSILRYERYAGMSEIPYGSTLSPATPETYAFLGSLYRELLSVFPGPFLHVGADEPDELGHGQSKPLADTLGFARLYLAHLILLRRAIGGEDRQFLFWADEAAKHPQILAGLPADFVPAVWNYDARDSFENVVRPFTGSGRSFFVCPGASNWSRGFPELEIAFPNIRGMIRQGQQSGALGEITCTWCDGGEALFGANWYPLVYAAAAAWQEGECDSAQFAKAFDWAFFRAPGDEIATAIQTVSQANGTVRRAADHLLDLDLLWFDPFENADREQVAPLLTHTRAMRAAQERAIELVEGIRGRAGRNADQLDVVVFAARRMHYFADKVLNAWRAQEAYRRARESRSDLESTQYLDLIRGMAGEGQLDCVRLRAEYERLWQLENRPYLLGIVLARFDRESAMWLDQMDRFRLLESRRRKHESLPPPEAVGLAKF